MLNLLDELLKGVKKVILIFFVGTVLLISSFFIAGYLLEKSEFYCTKETKLLVCVYKLED